jgi:hypothetical protein
MERAYCLGDLTQYITAQRVSIRSVAHGACRPPGIPLSHSEMRILEGMWFSTNVVSGGLAK